MTVSPKPSQMIQAMPQSQEAPLPQIEWDETTRHWWRFDPRARSMTHRTSGEKVVYRGRVSATGNLLENDRRGVPGGSPSQTWARFDYVFGDRTYPMLIEHRRVRYPNPWPERYTRPPYNAGPAEILDLSVWHLDHIRSAQLWRQENPRLAPTSYPEGAPYTLWRLADRAMVDAALLWPSFDGMPKADEIAINGGWLNGAWASSFYRRCGPDDPDWFRKLPASLELPGVRKPALALSEYTTAIPFAESPRWERVRGEAIGLHGERFDYPAALLRNASDGTLIGEAAGKHSYRFHERAGAIVVLRDPLYVTSLMTSSSEPNKLEGWPGTGVLAPDASWNLMLDGRCALGLTGSVRKPPSFVGKSVIVRDSISNDHETPSRYSADSVAHPLLSYDLWQWLYDCYLTALPFSSGFRGSGIASVTQGDIGRVYISGGFVGGIQILTTEVRLKLDVPSDTKHSSSWAPFFE